jgi:hypothetical protein
MMLSPIVDGLSDDLLRAAAVGGDEVQEAARLLTAALEPSVRIRLLGALGDAVAELSESLPSGRAELRLRNGEPELFYEPVAEQAIAPVPGETPPSATSAHEGDGDAESARITLRMPESLKRQVESAAAGEGVSLNSWLVAAAARALGRPSQPVAGSWQGPRRFTGFVRG